MNVVVPVPGRRGWIFAELITDAPHEMRRGVIHEATSYAFWAHGASPDEITAAAQAEIDAVYERRWAEMAELIDQGDLRGPNVTIESDSADRGPIT